MRIGATTSVIAIVAATVGVALVPSAAQAQAAPGAKPPASALDGKAAPAEQDGIQDIIVTASRRELSLQKTAIPVSVVTSEQIAAKGIVNIQQLTATAPSLKVGQAGGGALQVTTRGVGNFGANNANEPGVAINYDGTYVARAFGANGFFFDVSRVELLKGPQGTLYGRNSTGGVLSIITNDPGKEFGGTLTAEIGDYGLRRASGAINIPIAEGVALRVAGQGIKRDGYLTDGYNDDKEYAGRVKLKIDPTPDLSVLLEANFSANKGNGIAAVFAPFVAPSNPYVGPSDPRSNAIIAAVPGLGPFLPKIEDDGFTNNRSRQFIGTVNYDLGGAKATLIVANTRNTTNFKYYTPGFPVIDDTRGNPNYFTTAELRLGSTGNGPLKWVVGGFFYKEIFAINTFVNQGFTFADSRDVAFRTKSYSGFGEATYAITPTIRLTAGGRYTSDRKSLSGTTFNPPVPCLPPSVPMLDPIRGAVCAASDTGAATFSKFTYKLGAEADLGPNSLLYANYATGFKSGGFFTSPNFSPPGTQPSNTYRPENLRAFTLGSKNRFFNNTLQLNLEGYYWKYKDKQISHLGFVPPSNLILVTDNAGNATIYGLDASLQWQPTRNDNFGIDVQYMHSKYDKYAYDAVVPAYAQPAPPGAPLPVPLTGCSFSPTVGIGGAPRGAGVPGISTIDCSGRRVALAPTWAVGASYSHTFELAGGSTIVPRVSTQIESGYWIGEDYYDGEYQKSYIMSDASLTWTSAGDKFSVTGFVNNIENKAVGQLASLNATIRKALIVLRPPRTYGVRASINF